MSGGPSAGTARCRPTPPSHAAVACEVGAVTSCSGRAELGAGHTISRRQDHHSHRLAVYAGPQGGHHDDLNCQRPRYNDLKPLKERGDYRAHVRGPETRVLPLTPFGFHAVDKRLLLTVLAPLSVGIACGMSGSGGQRLRRRNLGVFSAPGVQQGDGKRASLAVPWAWGRAEGLEL